MEKCDRNEQLAEAILAFDTLYTTNHIQMLKLISSYLDAKSRHQLAMLIKWQELLYTLSFNSHYLSFTENFPPKKEFDFTELISLISPYCSEQELHFLLKFSQIQEMMKNYQDIAQYMPMITELMSAFGKEQNPFAQTTSAGDSPAMVDLLKGMLSEEQRDLFSLFMEGGFHES